MCLTREEKSYLKLRLFSDASDFKILDEKNLISAIFLLGKTRRSPVKHVFVPRLELTAATKAVKLFIFI